MSESRAHRYAEALGTPFPLPLGKKIRRVEAVMAVADAELAELRTALADAEYRAATASEDAEAAEAEVERLTSENSRLVLTVASRRRDRIVSELDALGPLEPGV